ncbi:MAG TPA: glycosyltransferase family 2 protein [candidate division Zixibacteria bacterium]|nr:glycosyltransferase family 2 protein [candidate division Zixibacteria bacterium]
MTARPDVSVIIPTRNRARSLERLLASIGALREADPPRAEFLFVDNGSTDGTGALLQREARREARFRMKVIEEPRPGKSNALNRGLAEAEGGIVILIDDDVVVDPAWLVSHWQFHLASGFAVAQGRVLAGTDPQGRPADPARLREYNIPIVDYGPEAREIRGFTGTNVSLDRRVVEVVGKFNPWLGPGASGYSEDTEYSRRIRAAGFRIGYAPGAVVFHELDPERYGRAYHRLTEYRKGLSRSLYRRESLWLRILPDLAVNCMRYGVYRALGRVQKAYRTEGRIMKRLGELHGRWRGAGSRGPSGEGEAKR